MSIVKGDLGSAKVVLEFRQAVLDREAMRKERDAAIEVLRQCWYWFDDHDDRLPSHEIHTMLRKLVVG